ncbi:MAG TPA: protein kinase, partial [Mycobacterium sp.]|nr:protein kinase [Mycobacterium sp.]
LDRTVAVKVLTADLDKENLERFIREQRAMGRLSGHPNIVTVLEVGATPSGRPVIVMPYHSRGALASLIRRHGPLDWRSVLQLGVKIAGALETAHRAGIIHRDVKPANILLTDYGDVRLTDFGIARIAGGFETDTGQITGTPAFTAPEVLSGATPTVASDLYGLGATLFCALTGHVAFERRKGESIVAQFLRISNQSAPEVAVVGIPDALASAIQAAMAKDPADRPASAAEFGARLSEIGRRAGVDVDKMAIRTDGSGEELFVEALTPTSSTGRRTHTGPATAPPTLATKFRPPRSTRTQVARPRLIEALGAGGGRRLTVIHAPVGYGKTTLAAQWAEELGRQGVKVAWLTIDDNDNNPAWFLTNLVEAIRRAVPAVARDLDEVLEERGEDAERYVLTSLINGIDECDEPVAVIVDDWHRITSAAVKHALGFLVEHGSDNLQVVVTSRSRSGLPLSRMRLHDELIEIDVGALCFDEAEAQSFLVDASGLDLARSEVCELCSSTDGWVAGLQLASLSLRGADTPAEVIGQISGRSRTIANFLAENVLSTLEPEMLQFLLTTSITERTCASLASALSDEPHGQAMLEEVEARDLFLRRIDDNGDWFRYHHLFADFLRRRLDRDHPELTTPLHERASEWFAKHQMIVEAVDHALIAGDTGRAVALVEADGRILVEDSQNATLLGVVDKLPAAAVASNPRLQLMLARANVVLHRMDAARAALQRVSTTLETMQGPDVAQLRATADVWEGTLRVHEDRTDGLDDLAAEALARPDELSPFVVSTAANVATFSALYKFDFDAVYRWQEWAGPYHRRNKGPYAVRYGHALVGMAAFEQLDLGRAEQCFRAARQVERQAGSGLHSRPARIAGALLAELLYQRGETAEAQQLLDENSESSGEEGIVEIINARFIVGARLAVLRGDRAAAAELLDEGAEVAGRLSVPRLHASVENERLLLGLATQLYRPPVEFTQRLGLGDGPVDGIDEMTAQL